MRMAIPSKFTTGGSGTRNPLLDGDVCFGAIRHESKRGKNVHQVSKLPKFADPIDPKRREFWSLS